MKRIIVFVLIAVIAVSACVFVINDRRNRGTCGDKAEWEMDIFSGTLTVSGEGEMYDFDSELREAPWKKVFGDYIDKVVIEEGVTKIGKDAFSSMYLGSISLPESLTHIGESAFSYCEIKDGIELPEGLTYIGKFAFSQSFLEEITIPESVTRVDWWAFNGAEVERVTVKGKLSVLESSVFYNCTKLEILELPSSLREIQAGALGCCDNMKSIIYEGTKEQWEKIVINPDYNSVTLSEVSIEYRG